MHVNILDYTSGSPRVLGSVRLTKDGYELTGSLPDHLQRLIADLWRQYPREFVRAVMLNISGSYVRAKVVPD